MGSVSTTSGSDTARHDIHRPPCTPKSLLLSILEVELQEKEMTPGEINVIMNINSTILNISAFDIDLPELGNSELDLVIVIFTSLVLGLMILTTVIGNVFVMMAILLDRH